MNRQFRWALGVLVVWGLTTGAAVASPHRQSETQQPTPQSKPKQEEKRGDHDRGPGPWWKSDRMIAHLSLTPAQSAKIEQIFRAEFEKIKPMAEQIRELERGVDAAMRANTADISAFARQVEQVEQKRSELNKARTVMLYRMRRVLTPEQNVKLQAEYDRREAERKKQDGDRRW